MYKSLLVHLLCCVSAMGSLGKHGEAILLDACNYCSSHYNIDEAKEN